MNPLKSLTNQWHRRYFYYLLCLICLIAPSSALIADSQQDATMAALYEQAFGKKNIIPAVAKVTTKPTATVAQAQNFDLAALYTQAFGGKKAVKKSSNTSAQSDQSGSNDLAALYAKAFGKKMTASPSKVAVELRVNKSTLGDVTLFTNSQGIISSADSQELLPLLKNILKEHIFKRIKKELSIQKHIAFKQLTSLGMKARYNSVNLSLDLEINPSLRKPRVLSMQRKKKAGVRDKNKITAEEISAFLNMYSTLGINSAGKKSNVKVKLEGSLGIGDTILETTVDINNKQWDVGRTTLTYDKPDKLQRFVVGNISTGNRNFQENLELVGLRVSKEFFMKPELQIRPKANESFVLETDSEVEVYINNQLRQRYYLKEGIYSLEDIGLYNGANNIRVKIIDAFGKVTEKTSIQYYDSHLLKPDLSLFSISVGYLSNKQAVSNEKLKNKPIFSAYYQRGLSDNLTISLDAQVSQNSFLYGAEAISSIPFGSLKNSIAFSGGQTKDVGVATRFEFKPNIQRQLIGLDTLREDMLSLDTKVGRFLDSWTISGEYRSKEFSMINQENTFKISNVNTNKKLKSQLQTNFGFDLTHNWRGNLNIGVQDYYEAEHSVNVNLSAIKRFNNGIRLSFGANYDSQDDYSVNLQLSIPIFREKNRRRKDLDILANSKKNTIESRLSIKPTSRVGKNSLAGSIEAIRGENSHQQKLNIQYRGNNFETSFNAQNYVSFDEEDTNTQQLNIGLNSSIACVGFKCSTSYPINDSFALITGPSNQDRPIAVSNEQNSFKYSDNNVSGLPDNYTALIRKKGSYAIIPLESYRFQNINIDESTLPNGYDIEETEFEVFPKYHQGFIINAGGEPSTILSGELFGVNKKPLGFKGGQWVSIEKEGKTIAFFSNKAGLFRVSSIPAGKYKLELFDYPDMQEIIINVPNKKGEVHNIGKLIIKE